MIKKLMPDRMFNSYRDITPEILSGLGIKALLLDIDNTLVTYDDPDPTDEVTAWLKQMNESGILTAFVSNNSDPSRVERFNKSLGYFAVSRAKKPLPNGFRRALEYMKVDACNAASVGDQIFTDVWAAKNVGAYAFLVPPIKDKTTLFFKAKRFLERPIIKKYKSKNQK
ncbi:MAG: YqeG family HAD IIIA-type phosphatase [Clostridia bacterium]|nr:YqeG family HAD IIIA-type phosphatase [Clostridia bacterium]